MCDLKSWRLISKPRSPTICHLDLRFEHGNNIFRISRFQLCTSSIATSCKMQKSHSFKYIATYYMAVFWFFNIDSTFLENRNSFDISPRTCKMSPNKE